MGAAQGGCWATPGAGRKRRYFGSRQEARSISSGVNKRGRCPVGDSDPSETGAEMDFGDPKAPICSLIRLAIIGCDGDHIRFGGKAWWGRQDSNLRRHSQRIYSPPPLPLGTLPRSRRTVLISKDNRVCPPAGRVVRVLWGATPVKSMERASWFAKPQDAWE